MKTRSSNHNESLILNGKLSLSSAINKNGDLDLIFYNPEGVSTSGDDILGPLGKWYEKDTVLTGLENNYILSGQQGIDVLGGGSNNDVLDGGEELYQDQYGNDVSHNQNQ